MTPNFSYLKKAYSARFSELKEAGGNITKEGQAFLLSLKSAMHLLPLEGQLTQRYGHLHFLSFSLFFICIIVKSSVQN
jgi:hypothetical protein